jgi:hypothetical protein
MWSERRWFPAMAALGNLHVRGSSVEKNITHGMKLLEEAFQKNSLDAAPGSSVGFMKKA